MLQPFMRSIRSRIPQGRKLIICLAALLGVVVIGSSVAAYHYATQANKRSSDRSSGTVVKPNTSHATAKKDLSDTESSSESAHSETAAQAEGGQPVSVTPQNTAPKPAQTTPVTKPPTTTATIAVGGLSVGTASTVSGMCSIPVSTSVKTNFNGSVALYFTANITANGQQETSSKYVTVTPDATIPVQHTLTLITPGTYTVNITMSVGTSSFSPAYTGPVTSYSGSTTGTASCAV